MQLHRCLPFLALAAFSALPAEAQNKKADRRALQALKDDVGYLASDALEGRRTGTAGEQKAQQYLVRRYGELGIPAYYGKYVHPFTFSLGREMEAASRLVVDGETIDLAKSERVFPMAFSGAGAASGDVIPDVMERDNVWIVPLYKSRDDAENPHYDLETQTRERVTEAVKQGATAVIFYDPFGSKQAPERTARYDGEAVAIPVLFWTGDASGDASKNIQLDLRFRKAERTGSNVAAYLDNGARYTVVIGAHYDHLGFGEDGNSLHPNAAKSGQIHNGADDNASGTAGVLYLAQRLKKSGLKKYNYLFLHFSGEELGLIGSKAFVKDMGLDSNNAAYMVNMDMIGRLADSTRALTIGGLGTSPAWGQVVPRAAEGFRLVRDSSGAGPSDHTSFYHAGIPVLFFFTGIHPDYHKPSDDADRINYPGELAVLQRVYGLVEDMERLPKPQYTATRVTPMGKTRFKVTLGIMPDYAWTERGLRVDGVTDGRPAQKAGLQRGDIITQLGEFSIQGIQSYMEGLGKFRKGDKTTLRFLRGEKEMAVEVEFQ